MVPHGIYPGRGPIWMGDPSVYMVYGFCIEVIFLGIAFITAVHAITRVIPDFRICSVVVIALIVFKYLLTFHLFNQNPEIGLLMLLVIQTSVMVILVTLTLLFYGMSIGKALIGAMLILIAQYVMNVLVNILICAPFLTPTDIDSILRHMKEMNSIPQ